MKKKTSPPVTIVSKTEPSVIKQGELYVIVVFPDSAQSRRSARVSSKIAKVCGHAPSGTSKEQKKGKNVPQGTNRNVPQGTSKNAEKDWKFDDVPLETFGDVPTVLLGNVPTDRANVPLVFDDDNGVIRWGRKSISLGPKSRRFVEVLWYHGISSVVELSELETNVWGDGEGDPKDHFVPINTVKQFIKRLRKSLKSVGFPYEIDTVKKISEKFPVLQITGFSLKKP